MQALDTARFSYDRRRLLLGVGGTVALLGLAGCADKPPPPPPPTVVALTVLAGVDANPDANGRASPLNVRAYALKTPSAFQEADFFTLFDKDQATLGADLVQREEFLLRPGENRQLQWVLPPEAKVVAVMAAYRDLEHARWRATLPVAAHQTRRMLAQLGARQVLLTQSP